MISISSCFLFSCSLATGALYSFPTRRSSDLNREREGLVFVLWGSYAQKKGAFIDTRFRSEEHTSELQSLTNLVCRLLLEKKNSKHASTSRLTTSQHHCAQPQRHVCCLRPLIS